MKKTRVECFVCKKKLSPAATFSCYCENVFCGTHRYVESHQCPKMTQKKDEERKNLEEQLIKVVPSKIVSL